MNQRSQKKIKPWTEKHQAETRAELLRLAADLGAAGEKDHAWDLAHFAITYRFDSEAELREKVKHPDLDSMVRKIRARAEGREVKDPSEVFFRVRLADGSLLPQHGVIVAALPKVPAFRNDDAGLAQQVASNYPGARVARVTLKRTRFLQKAPTS